MKLRCDINCGPKWSVLYTTKHDAGICNFRSFFETEKAARQDANEKYLDANVVMVALFHEGTEIKRVYKEA